jgi:hypothetical protein
VRADRCQLGTDYASLETAARPRSGGNHALFCGRDGIRLKGSSEPVKWPEGGWRAAVSGLPSRQHTHIPALMPPHHVAQVSRGDHFDLISPLVQVPNHLDPAAGGERDA